MIYAIAIAAGLAAIWLAWVAVAIWKAPTITRDADDRRASRPKRWNARG